MEVLKRHKAGVALLDRRAALTYIEQDFVTPDNEFAGHYRWDLNHPRQPWRIFAFARSTDPDDQKSLTSATLPWSLKALYRTSGRLCGQSLSFP
jgi:hypothetical protein